MLKKLFIVLAAFVVIASLAYPQGSLDKVKSFEDELRSWGENPLIVNVVKESNKKLLSDAEIKRLDDEWKATTGISAFIRGFLTNDTADLLQLIQKGSNPKGLYSEIFVMNIQGLIVGESDKTSDYWQADEAKFADSYAGGKGAVHYGDIEFDDSAQAYLVQVSVPVMDPDSGKAIGAITFGVNMDTIQ